VSAPRRPKPLAVPVRVLLVWLAFLCAAILNGALRQKVLVVMLGAAGAHLLSSVLLSGVILGATYLALPWLRLDSNRRAWIIGVSWLGLTVAFEFLVGHYWFHASWSALFAEYNLARGRIWILVLVTTLLAPVVARVLRP
jgi:hypothetical protein